MTYRETIERMQTTSGAERVIRTYMMLLFGNTLAAAMIWGINTLFLLHAGLSNFEAFLANAFFTLGMVLFEIPTGLVADGRGRRVSYLLGTVTLAVSTLLYYVLWSVGAPFGLWAVVSMLLGLGFTFFSGAVEAWLVDALEHNQYAGSLESVFGRGQMVSGAAMLIGTLGGGVLAQLTNLGVPYIVRGLVLLLLFGLAWRLMHDEGFAPVRQNSASLATKQLVRESIDAGLRVPPVRWLMLSAIGLSSVGFYVFYALQPYLLELYGDTTAYWAAGLAAALVAVAQMCGGFVAARIGRLLGKRTNALIALGMLSVVMLLLLNVTTNFYLALVAVFVWGMTFAAMMPIRQSYLNGMIPKAQRATVLSADSMMSSLGGVVVQPGLARAADVWSYGASFAVGAVVQCLALPALLLSRRYAHRADRT